MTSNADNFQGRLHASGARLASVRGCAWFIAVIALLLCGSAAAENILQDIAYAPLPGGKVQVTLKFAAPVAEPRIFATENPPRIAIDIADTRNAVSQRRIDVNNGATSGISAVEAAGRTRVVVDLFRPATYETKAQGNDLVVTINNGAGSGSATATAVATTDQTKTIVGQGAEISNIDFRRGKNGEGRIVVTFSGEGVGADLQRRGDELSLDFYNVRLPVQLAQRLDVLDFATPVQTIETRTKGGGAHMSIIATAPYEQLAYQSGNQYVVEVSAVKPKVAQDPNAPPEYTGNRVTFNFQDIPVRSVLQLIADMSELNIVVADSVRGNVTLRLINVPWDQALDIVLQAKGLDKRKNGNVVWIAPQKEISDREQALAEARRKLQGLVETVTEYIPINYGKARDIAALISLSNRGGVAGGSGGGGNQGGAGFLSERGRVTFDERTNTLLVHDTPDRVKMIRDLVAKLDRPVQQVLIEARVVVATDNFARDIGAKFGISGGYQVNNTVVSTAGTLTGADQMANLALNNRFAGTGSGLPNTNPGGAGAGIQVPSLANRLNVSLPASKPSAGSFGLTILGADYLLDLELSAGETEAKSELISNPRVITANQQEADIKQGQEIGYVTFNGQAGAATANVQFKEAVLELKVTPTITADGRVFLTLDVKKDNINSLVPNPGGGFVPQLDKREITTSVLVDNGQTVVLGGVYEFDKVSTLTKVPFLGDIPGLGVFFRDLQKSNSKAELLIFVTPRILDEKLK
jgi:type IV pilus assembly protein PilQ